ncbi:hypothetical protein CKO38_01565 [Rhodospirillum rubrum]|uniref:hypothetical protein n=1 Tax=Rhodospirillum rubrum TaxID=1085 RepID=UPI001904ECC6|nr:hypothetical protein [Rhodospirillum rubrum]MBK1663433.1 hypothetical protein [Rhodospirillum rubrum]MBK1675384.1 hypothetical protein [Rhodospirillum rubrum]
MTMFSAMSKRALGSAALVTAFLGVPSLALMTSPAQAAPSLATPLVTFSFDRTQADPLAGADRCESVLYNVAIGAPVPLDGAPCIESYLLASGQARDHLTTDDPTNELFSDTLLGTTTRPDPVACENVLTGLAVGQALPATVAPCVTAYMLTPLSGSVAGGADPQNGG